jgi:hypothetical protein
LNPKRTFFGGIRKGILEADMQKFDSRRGGILAGLLITALVLACVAVTIGLTVARNIRVHTESSRNGDNVSIETPAGHFSIRAHDQSGLAMVGVPKYPGALQRPHNRGGAIFEWTSNDGREEKGLTVAGDEMITSDSARKVVEFYQAQLPSWIIADDDEGGFKMELSEGGYKRIIVIHGKHDGTHIGVATIGSPAAN